ncbi:mitogen-activated protein kinase kinase kinase 14 [Protopterus annectens]|uniref:mitogen-activated protein kinase kinase kinase 14 n=1 Tax=Protopterus annectens TaxID=7888 RepID=UPI001CFB9BD9|nr:mitogen-activated protein kinase kinase kinase 14 [Protopterus annectens]
MAVIGIGCQETAPTTGHQKDFSISKPEVEQQLPKQKMFNKQEDKKVPEITHYTPESLQMLAEVLTKGTAQEGTKKDVPKISVIAQAQCENSQEFSPTCPEGPIIAGHKSYSRPEQFEHIPNNVASATEKKIPYSSKKCQYPGQTRKKRKKSPKNKTKQQRKPSKGGSKTPEQESTPPIPVQEDDCAHSSCFLIRSNLHDSKALSTINELPNLVNIKGRWDFMLTDKSSCHKVINPDLCLNHVKPNHRGDFFPQPETTFPSFSRDQPLCNTSVDKCVMGQEQMEDQDFASYQLEKDLFMDSDLDVSSLDEIPDVLVKNQCERDSLEECEMLALGGHVSHGETRQLQSIVKLFQQQGQHLKEGFPVSNDNEGVLLNEKLKPVDYEYREESHWVKKPDLLGCGSFGDVYEVEDKTTHFSCAAKQLSLATFRPEELQTWSSVTSCPQIVPLYGTVRDGRSLVIFMEKLSGGSLNHLIKERGCLPEVEALHYHFQVLEALDYLHQNRILHGDIKADNVLLSSDKKQIFLCDFGHSCFLPVDGSEKNPIADGDIPGTETHMAPEVAKGCKYGTKVDIWSSCCMMLHMLNGCHPWTRYYNHPLHLKIAMQPPPTNEIPDTCHPCTADVIKAGLQKDPGKRASASKLKSMVKKALKEVGDLSKKANITAMIQKGCVVNGSKQEAVGKTIFRPGSPAVEGGPRGWSPPDMQKRSCFSEFNMVDHTTETLKKTEFGKSWSFFKEDGNFFSLHGRIGERKRNILDQEFQQLEREFCLNSLSQPYAPELQEQMLSCLSLESLIYTENSLKDSLKGSYSQRDDLSSGIHSWCSQSDQCSFSFNSKFVLGKPTEPHGHFNGIRVKVHSLEGECLNICELRGTNIGRIAVGISRQVSEPAFSLQTANGEHVSCEMMIPDSGIDLQCISAPDYTHDWAWRIRNGKLEVRS